MRCPTTGVQPHVMGPPGPLDLEVSTAALLSYNQTSSQF